MHRRLHAARRKTDASAGAQTIAVDEETRQDGGMTCTKNARGRLKLRICQRDG
jgi:hypothetical protein